MTAPRDCRPPEGRDAVWCWVHRFSRLECAFFIAGHWLRVGYATSWTPHEFASVGYTFHSIAEPPHG